MRKLLLSFAVLAAVSTFLQAEETMRDVCGNTYPVVTIGEQTWMAENLKCNQYDTQSEAYNASWIINHTIQTSYNEDYTPYYTDATGRPAWSTKYGDYSAYVDLDQVKKFGYLFNWAAAVGVKDGSEYKRFSFEGDRQGICPNGWHVPSNAEWQTLADYLDGNDGMTDAGKQLKTTSGWYNGGNGTDDYGFAILPAGFSLSIWVHYVGADALLWSADSFDSDAACYRYTDYLNDVLCSLDYGKTAGLSVRCLKTITTPATEAEADATPSVSKQLIDGQIVIIKGDKRYNLQGVEIK